MKYAGKTIALQEEICVKIELEPLFIELLHKPKQGVVYQQAGSPAP